MKSGLKASGTLSLVNQSLRCFTSATFQGGVVDLSKKNLFRFEKLTNKSVIFCLRIIFLYRWHDRYRRKRRRCSLAQSLPDSLPNSSRFIADSSMLCARCTRKNQHQKKAPTGAFFFQSFINSAPASALHLLWKYYAAASCP